MARITRARKGNFVVLYIGCAMLVAAVLASAGPALAAEPPIAAYSLDAGTGTVAEDLAAENDGTISGPKWAEGKYGTALRFDGAAENNCVTVPNSPDLELTGNFTMEAWVRPEGSLLGDTILFKEMEPESGPSYIFSVGLNEAGKLEGSFLESGEGEEVQEVVAPKALPEHKWSHVAYTFDGTKQRLYVNGELVATHAASVGTVASSGPLQIGCAKGWESDYFWGKIDEVRIYDRTLPVGEIEADRDGAIQTPPSPLPAAAFSFDAGEGEVAEDFLGSHEGTIEGATWTEGRFGNALYFDGAAENNCVTVPDSPELQLSESFTVEAWVRPEGSLVGDTILFKELEAESGPSYIFSIGFNEAGQLEGSFLETEGGEVVQEVVAPESLPEKKWSHVAFSFDGEKQKLYVNGELAATHKGGIGATPSEGPLQIGCAKGWESDYFWGKIDEVRIYHRALTAGEVEADRDAPIQTPPSAEPVAAYTLDEGEGMTAADLTGVHNGTVEGAAWGEGKWGAALEFDGVSDCLTVPDRFDLQLRESFTLEAWIKPSATDGSGPIIYKESGGFLSYALALGLEPGPYYVPEGAVAYEPGEAAWVHGEVIPKETWSHVAMSYDGEYMRLYVNSELLDVEEALGAVGSTGALRVGCAPNSEEVFGGSIDEVRLYNRALPAGEIESDSKNDHAAPTIELSGPLTEGLKEGTSEYLLKVHAVDGVVGKPGVGVRKVSIAVDGTVVDSVEQECPGFNCSLNREWTFDTKVFGFESHEVTIAAEDQAGNATTRLLPLPIANGSLPACSLTESETAAPPDEEEELAGGGSAATYHGSEGEEYVFRSPPAAFNPKTASDEELALYGLPPRPPITEPGPRERWEQSIGSATTTSKPGGCMMTRSPELAGSVHRSFGPRWSGYYAYAPNAAANKWRAAKAEYKQPMLNQVCFSPAGMASWVGIGGLQGKGFFQAGTNAPYGYPITSPNPKYTVAAFTEFFRGGQEGVHDSENPVHFNLKIAPGDKIVAHVEWKPAKEAMYMHVLNRNTNEGTPGVEIKVKGQVYDGQSVDFIPAERPSGLALQNFGSVKFENSEGFVSGGQWKKLGDLGHLYRQRLQESNKKGEPVGQVMASPGALFPDRASFLDQWRHCAP